MKTRPDVGTSSPASKPKSVVFPDPDAPRIAIASPGSTIKLTPLKMDNSAPPLGTRLLKFSTRTIGSPRFIFASLLLLLSWSVGQASAAAPAIMIFGDSLSASYGLQREAGWVALLEQKL